MTSSWPLAARPDVPGLKRGSDGSLISVNGVFNYQSGSIVRSLVANGQVFTKRDGSGSDGELIGVKWAPTEVTVRNARLEPATLDKQGFELTESPTTLPYDSFYDAEQILTGYYPECVDLVKKITKASTVVAFDHNIRSASGKASGKDVKGGSAVQGPASLVHGDYTVTSGPRRLEQMGQVPKANDTLGNFLGGKPLVDSHTLEAAKKPGGRFAIVNVWRSIRSEPVETFPLACCDASTVTSEDLCVFEIQYADRIGENYFAAHATGHKWYYYPRMVRDEAMLIKQWDSAGSLSGGEKSTFALHSAFIDPSAGPEAPDRESIEVRCICVFEPEVVEEKELKM